MQLCAEQEDKEAKEKEKERERERERGLSHLGHRAEVGLEGGTRARQQWVFLVFGSFSKVKGFPDRVSRSSKPPEAHLGSGDESERGCLAPRIARWFVVFVRSSSSRELGGLARGDRDTPPKLFASFFFLFFSFLFFLFFFSFLFFFFFFLFLFFFFFFFSSFLSNRSRSRSSCCYPRQDLRRTQPYPCAHPPVE